MNGNRLLTPAVACVLLLATVAANAEPPAADRPVVTGERRIFRFNFSDATNAEILGDFNQQSGLFISGVIPEGRISFDTGQEEMSFDLALNRLRVAMSRQGDELYWLGFFEPQNALEVVRCTNICGILPLDRIFLTVDQFHAARLKDHEIAMVVYTPSNPDAKIMNVVSLAPSYVRIRQYAYTNALTAFATAKDLRLYLDLATMLDDAATDADDEIIERQFLHVEQEAAVEAVREVADPVAVYGDLAPRDRTDETTSAPAVRVWTDCAHRRIVVACPSRGAWRIRSALIAVEPPELRAYRFQLIDRTYEEILAAFSRQTGLAIFGDIPEGTTSFDTCGEYVSFDVALHRLCMLVFQHPADQYWLSRPLDGESIELVRVLDFFHPPSLDRIFASAEDFLAHKPDEGVALVLFSPANPVAALPNLAPYLPKHIRIQPYADENALTIFGAVDAVERALAVARMFDDAVGDGQPEVIEQRLEGTTFSAVIDALRSVAGSLLVYDGPTPRRIEGTAKDETCIRVWTNRACCKVLIVCGGAQAADVAAALRRCTSQEPAD